MTADLRVIELTGPAVGGIRNHVTELTRQLRERGIDVEWCGPVADDSGAEVAVDVPAGFSPARLFRARRQLRQRNLIHIDLIHAHGLKAAVVALIARTGRPVVFTVHNLVDGSGRSGRIPRAVEAAACRRVDHLIAASPEVAERCRALAPRIPCSVIIPVFEAPRPRLERSAVRKLWGIEPSSRIVVSVARLHPQKRLGLLLDLWPIVRASCADAELVIVGAGPERAQLAERARQMDGIRMVSTDIAGVDAMAASDAIAITSGWEGIPIVALEAIELGVPIVSTDVGIVSDVITPSTGRVVSEGHGLAQRFAAALVEVLSSISRPLATVGEPLGTDRPTLVDRNVLVDRVLMVYRSTVGRR